MRFMPFVTFLLVCILLGCHSGQVSDHNSELSSLPVAKQDAGADTMMVTNLRETGPQTFAEINEAFSQNNPGYGMRYLEQTREIPSQGKQQVVFVQEGGGTASLSSGETSKISVGDIILLNEKTSASTDSLIDYLVFTVPHEAPDTLPSFIRPDWDPNITDIPGGCATETNAYRRILLTWLGKVGPYLFQSINAHRVRIMDSFSHYHPVKGGFDEFYLVQMALPDARIITSHHKAAIVDPESEFSEVELQALVKETPLKVGDLVYLPRGVIHRGVGGVLAQVITVPGFVPQAEIGVDHHLKRISDSYGLANTGMLPYNKEAAKEVVVK